MRANSSALQKLAEDHNWTIPELAQHLGINYSYLFRVMRGEKQGGAKLWTGIYTLCKQEGLSFEDFLILEDD